MIGTVTIVAESLILDGNMVTLHAGYSGDANGLTFNWTPPPGATLVAPQTGERLSWVYRAATDNGTWEVEAVDPAAADSPVTATITLAVQQAITRFGRTYVRHNPGPPGPETWILAGPGATPEGFGGVINRAQLSPRASSMVDAGMPIYLDASGMADRARANVFKTAVVCGVVVDGGVPGHEIGYTPDGTVTRTDWTLVTGNTFLKPGVRYFLSPSNAGRLQESPPQLAGEYIVQVGRALSENTLEVEIQGAIRA